MEFSTESGDELYSPETCSKSLIENFLNFQIIKSANYYNCVCT